MSGASGISRKASLISLFMMTQLSCPYDHIENRLEGNIIERGKCFRDTVIYGPPWWVREVVYSAKAAIMLRRKAQRRTDKRVLKNGWYDATKS
jgi:hypothetical protein